MIIWRFNSEYWSTEVEVDVASILMTLAQILVLAGSTLSLGHLFG